MFEELLAQGLLLLGEACSKMSYEAKDHLGSWHKCWREAFVWTQLSRCAEKGDTIYCLSVHIELKKGLTNIFVWVHKHPDMIKIFPILALIHVSIILPKSRKTSSTAQKHLMN